MPYQGFRDLKVWQKAREFRQEIFKLSKKFPKEELYGLTSQLRRSAYSITANMAEGHRRNHYQENMRFCRISRGSLSETLDHLITAVDNEYITQSEFEVLEKKEKEIEI